MNPAKFYRQINFSSDFSAFSPLTLKGESRKINLHPLGTGVNQVEFSMILESVKVELISRHIISFVDKYNENIDF